MLSRFCGGVAVLALALGGTSSRAQAPLQFRWEGTIEVTHTFEPAVAFRAADWNGSFRDHRRITVLARESRRADVTDATGRIVGQVVWLEDDGTRWSGAISDTETHLGNIRLLGDQAGSGGAQVFGLVYRSLVTPNPLDAVLPDGSYFLHVAPGPIRYQFTLREPGRPDETDTYDSMAAFLASDASLTRRLATGAPLTVASVTAAMTAPARPGDMTEGRRRALVDGAMSGDYSHTDRESGTTDRATWSLRRRLRINGLLSDADANWRPSLLGRTSVTASIDPALGKTGRFRFTLYDVSREPGQSLNGGSGTGLDLRFADDQPVATSGRVETATGWTIETSEAALQATANVTALDYGAWGRLKAEINVDGEWYSCLTPSGASSITLPADSNGNRIWDTWERNANVWGRPASEDADEEPEAASAGDGFSIFEEYRGFMVGTDWVSLDPRRKELFVFDEAGEGIGLFGQSGVLTYLIDQTQYDATRVVNMNRGYASAGAQKGLHVKDGSLEPGTLGLTSPLGSPNQVRVITIDLEQIRDDPDPATLAAVLAHEIGHGVAIPHHGDYAEGSCGGGEPGLIAIWRGAFSGDRTCVMSYPGAAYYRGWNGQCYPFTWPSAWGERYCTARAGTGFNAGPRRIEDGHALPVSGDATHGNCQHALRLK